MSDIKIIGELPPIADPIVTPSDQRLECCRHAENLEYYHVDQKLGQMIYRCKKCGRRHFEINCDPGRLGLRR